MKKDKKSEEMTKDLEKLKKELLSNELEDSEIVSLGENRKQFFIRLPTRLTNQIQLKSVDKIKILWRCSEEKVKISLEVVKHEEG